MKLPRSAGDQEIVDHASFLLFAAHDTTTSTLNHLMYYLAKHQDWQQRLRDEGAAQHKDYLDYEDLGNVVDTARSVVDQVCCFINAGLFCANWDYTEGCLSILD